jgi:alpha-glucosidase
MMNIHDEYRPSGFSHTYPNLLTQEGICGNEEFPDGDHDVRLAFTRMLCGAADYTICYYDKRLKNTHGHQLAASMVYASPLVTLFWYDKPQQYTGEMEIAWFEQLPTTWDETRVLAGDPESYILIARRKGDTWFIAALNNGTERDITVDLRELNYQLSTINYQLFTDDPSVKTKTHIRITEKQLKKLTKKNSLIPLHLQANGGATMIIK